MLSARRVTSSLLGQRSQLLTHRLQQSLAPTSSPSLASSVTFRSFSQQKSEPPSNHERKLVKRSKSKVMGLPTALKTVQEIHDSDAVKMTKTEVSTLVKALIKHKKHDECIQLFRVFQEQNVPLKALTRVSGFSILCLKEEFRLALREFEILQKEEVKMKPWMYAAALDAAIKTDQWDAVREIFTQLVTRSSGKEGDTQVEVTGEKVSELLENARERGLKLSEFALRVLVIYAEKSYQPKMALDVFSMLQNEGVNLGIDVYASMFVACGEEKLWSDVMMVFDAMPEALVPQLNDLPLGYVLWAHTYSRNDELIQRGLDIFGGHKEKWSKAPCSAALAALLQTRQFDVLFALANDMLRRGMVRNSFTYKMLALAYIRDGSTEKARQFLDANVQHLNTSGRASCYRELIDFYANTNGDVKEACQLYLEMIGNKLPLKLSDWCNALELALQMSDHTTYWSFRTLLWQQNPNFEGDLPAHLVLSSSEIFQIQDPGQEGSKVKVHPDVALALKSFRGMEEMNGAGLTEQNVSRVLAVLAKNNQVKHCIAMWDFLETYKVRPKAFARVTLFGMLCNARQYDYALSVFKTLMDDKLTPRTWAYTKAFNAAIKLKKHSFVTDTLRHIQDHGVKLAASDYVNIIASCAQAKEWALAMTMLSSMQGDGLQPPLSTYNALLEGCGEGNYWNMVIEVYNSMPSDLRPLLQGKALGSVLLAHSRADSDEVKQRTADICKSHFATSKSFPFEMAMTALLESKYAEDVLSVATDATNAGAEWTPQMYRSVVMANIHSGSMELAKQLLQEHVMRLTNISAKCFREIIRYYAKDRGDVLEASKLSLQMVQNNMNVSVDDWRTALELALQLPDHAIYWELRRWMRLHGGAALFELPNHLFLPEEDEPQHATTSN